MPPTNGLKRIISIFLYVTLLIRCSSFRWVNYICISIYSYIQGRENLYMQYTQISSRPFEENQNSLSPLYIKLRCTRQKRTTARKTRSNTKNVPTEAKYKIEFFREYKKKWQKINKNVLPHFKLTNCVGVDKIYPEIEIQKRREANVFLFFRI